VRNKRPAEKRMKSVVSGTTGADRKKKVEQESGKAVGEPINVGEALKDNIRG